MQLVERAGLLAHLDALLAEARAGSGSVVLLGGEAGVGKTSVARAFVERSGPSHRVLWGMCEPLIAPEAFGPFHDMAPLARVIAAQPSRAALLRAMLDELSTPPTLMVIDDAHWADDATLDALRFLGRRAHTTPGMLLITFREDETPGGSPLRSVLGDLATAPGSHRIGVLPLTVEAVTELAEGHAVEAGRLHAATGGNAFYVTEVLAAEGWTLPPTVADAVLARASRLDAAARTVLEVVSLAPGGLEPDIAVDLSGVGASALDTCVEHGMLVLGSERLTFRHELARLAVEGSLPPSRRRRFLRRILERLERRGGVEAARLAHHADAAGDAAAVLRYAPLAAHEASQRAAHRAAAAHLARAVDRARSAPPGYLADLVSAWADQRMRFDDAGEVLRVRQHAVELRRRAGDRRGEARDLIELARMGERLGGDLAAPGLTIPALDLAIQILEALPPGPELAYAYACDAYRACMAGRYDEALRRVAATIDLAAATDVPKATILALRVRGTIGFVREQTADGLTSYDQARRLAVAVADHEGEVAVVIDTGVDLLLVRRYEEAISRFQEAIDLGAAVDLDYRVNFARASLAQISFEQGRWAEADRMAVRLLAEETQEVNVRVGALEVRGRIAVRRGLRGAASTLREARALVEGRDPSVAWEAAVGLAEAAWLDGRPEDIPPLVGDFHEMHRRVGLRWPAGQVAFWLWRAGAISALPGDLPEPFALQMAGNWRAAAAAWEQIGCPYEQAEALADGDEPAMRRALELFSRLGAEPAAGRVRERMRRAGLAHIPARPHRSNRTAPAQLTPRQLEILELLERGLTNAEIGTRLFITQKTAGHHVSAVLAKLGARSRTEAASIARKMGIAEPQT